MSSPDSGVNKLSVGLVAAVCLAIAGGLYLFFPEREGMMAAFWRVGLVMFAFWLALPALQGLSGAKVLPIIAGAVVLAVRPKLVVYLLPLIIAIGVVAVLLRPRSKRRHNPPQ